MSRTIIIDAKGEWILGDGGERRPYRWWHKAVDAVSDWWGTREFRARQRLAERRGARFYGDGGTVHKTGHVDVEVNERGEVVAVWFRCQPLPFKQAEVDLRRSLEMKRMYARGRDAVLAGIEVIDPPQRSV